MERKTRLDGSVAEFVCEVIALEVGRHAILRYVIDREWPIGGVDLRVPVGAVTIAHYWTDRPYNVYHWLEAGRTLAYYCNVATETTIADDAVGYTDLAVDVLVRPSGEAVVLDEDEVPPDLAPAWRRIIARALDTLTADPRRLAREIETATRQAVGS